MNRTLRSAFALGAFALLGLNRPANAQSNDQFIYFPVNTTISSDVPSPPNPNQYAIIGYANAPDFSALRNPTSPTVSLVSGTVWGNMQVYNQSVFNMTGGRVNVRLRAHDTSVVNIFGGGAGTVLEADDYSTVNFKGGSTGYGLYANDSSIVNVSGGNAGHIIVGAVSVTGNTVNGTLNMKGG